MGPASDPEHLSHALSEVIARRGLARVLGNEQLQATWKEVAGEKVFRQTRVTAIRNGVMQIAVSNAALLSELAGFEKQSLLTDLQEKHPELRIRDLKFRLKGSMRSKQD